jgi:hypothetical protein
VSTANAIEAMIHVAVGPGPLDHHHSVSSPNRTNETSRPVT